MRKTFNILFGVCIMLCVQNVSSQDVFGNWKTIDDRTGLPKGLIKIYKDGGIMYGIILKILEEGSEEAVCDKCKGDNKDMPIVGMQVLDGLVKSNNEVWKGGTLFDPEQAMTFRCKIWLNPDNPNELMVRGYLAFFYRTQTWIRSK
jgi:uncharacterized protein (DUF2147 family)